MLPRCFLASAGLHAALVSLVSLSALPRRPAPVPPVLTVLANPEPVPERLRETVSPVPPEPAEPVVQEVFVSADPVREEEPWYPDFAARQRFQPIEFPQAAAPVPAEVGPAEAAPDPAPVLPTRSAPPTSPAPAASSGVVPARPLGGQCPSPEYPAAALRQGLEGLVRLDLEIGADGRVGRVTLVQSSGHSVLDRAAAEAVQRWRFAPARRGGEPIPSRLLVPVRFLLR